MLIKTLDKDLSRFMDVDLIDFLGKISEKVIIHYPKDFEIDKNRLHRAAVSHNTNEKRLVWHVCSYGTHLCPERDVFIRDSSSYMTMTEYRQNEPDMFGYVIEVSREDDGKVIGNVFEVGNYADYANHIWYVADPLRFVSLIYNKDWGVNAGKVVTVSRKEYDDDRHRLMSESGTVSGIIYRPTNSSYLEDLLSNERTRRMSYSIGGMDDHLMKLSHRLADIRNGYEKPEKQPKGKPSIFGSLRKGSQRVQEYKAQKALSTTNHNKQIIKESI